tara:strand:+ start:6761 stop:7504 length:744 start_codon:yes stop_codon:yes gene_type:complete
MELSKERRSVEVDPDTSDNDNFLEKVFGYVSDNTGVGPSILERGATEVSKYRDQLKEDLRDPRITKDSAVVEGMAEARSGKKIFEALIESFNPRDKESVMKLQETIGAKPDGIFGPKSLEAMQEYTFKSGGVVPQESQHLFEVGPESAFGEYKEQKSIEDKRVMREMEIAKENATLERDERSDLGLPRFPEGAIPDFDTPTMPSGSMLEGNDYEVLPTPSKPRGSGIPSAALNDSDGQRDTDGDKVY